MQAGEHGLTMGPTRTLAYPIPAVSPPPKALARLEILFEIVLEHTSRQRPVQPCLELEMISDVAIQIAGDQETVHQHAKVLS